MRFHPVALLAACSICAVTAQETPLSSLPYTPSLETKFMDKTADPCNNFFQYACGNWNKLNPIPPDQASWSVYGKMADDNARFLWGLLDAAAKPDPARDANEQKIGDLFQACMDQGAVEQAGIKPLEPALALIAALRSVEDIAGFVGGQHQAGLDRGVLFGFGPNADYDNSSQMMAFLFAGGLGLPDRDYYTNSDAKSQEIRQRYVQHVTRMFLLLGESTPHAEADAKSVMSIETELARASLTRVERRNPYNLKHKISREDLLHTAPAFDWDIYFKQLGAPAFTTVDITEPKFFQALNDALSHHNLTDWRAYLRWHLMSSHAPYLSKAFELEDFEFNSKYLEGAKEMPARWKKCTRVVDDQLGDALGRVFVGKTFGPSTKEDALKVTKQIEDEMERDIKDLSWMSSETKTQALEKLHAIVNKIGYPDKWRDYSTVSITPDALLNDVQQASAFEEHRALAKIGQPVDRREWFMSPPTVNAYYDPQTNDINFPAGVLQPPLFDPKMDAAPNYGNTGSTIGHELTHGFDDEGRQFDAHGNLRDWWTPADAKAFEERADCVRNQYAGYTVVDDIKINSKLTAGEDIADLGGTLLAFIAWKHATQGQSLPPVDGLTPDQRFFVGMAQWACGDERMELKRMRAITDPHSPLEYRVNGVVGNLSQFAEAFSCKPGNQIMRAKACRVW